MIHTTQSLNMYTLYSNKRPEEDRYCEFNILSIEYHFILCCKVSTGYQPGFRPRPPYTGYQKRPDILTNKWKVVTKQRP